MWIWLKNCTLSELLCYDRGVTGDKDPGKTKAALYDHLPVSGETEAVMKKNIPVKFAGVKADEYWQKILSRYETWGTVRLQGKINCL